MKKLPMKKGRPPALLFAAALASAFTVALLTLAGCPNPGGDGEPALTGIRVETSKTTYIQDEDLDLTTITVTGTYSDGSEKPVAISAANITGYDKDKAETQIITVTVEGLSATFTVTVKTRTQAAIDAAQNAAGGIAVSESGDGSDVPAGTKWVKPAEKAALDEAIAAVRELVESGAGEAEIAAALEALEKAVDEFTAKSENWSYTVTFDNNGGTGATAPKTVAKPATTVVSLPPEPARSGYTFNGWNTKADGTGSAFTAATPVSADITVYARWTEVEKHTVSFDSRGGSPVADMTADHGATILKPGDPGRSGYTFGGWYREVSLEHPWNFASDRVTGPATLYAKWIDENVTAYELSFDYQDGRAKDTHTVAGGEKVSEPDDPARTGYTFLGWYKEAAGANPWNFTEDTVTGDTTLYAKWLANGSLDITIGFNYGDISVSGSDGTNNIYRATAEPRSITLCVSEAYTDIHWYIDGGEAEEETGNSITLNASVYAITPHSITFTGRLDGVFYSRIIPFTVKD